jgi:hypothetical protein
VGFRSLQRSRIRRATARGHCQPATFRPQGLATLSAAYYLRARAGFLSHRRRSWDSPFGASSSRKVATAFPRRSDPRAVYPVGFPCAEALGRPNGPRLLGFDPSGSPSRPKQDWCADRRMLPWASPSQGLPEEASREPSSALLPRASRKPALRPGAAGASEFRSASTSPHPPPASRRAGQGNPHRVLAPDQT